MENLINKMQMLDDYISDKNVGLKKYVKKENPNQFFIDKENNELAILTDIFNSFQQIVDQPKFPILFEIGNTMESLEKLDSNLSGHMIIIRYRDSTVLAKTQIDCFQE